MRMDSTCHACKENSKIECTRAIQTLLSTVTIYTIVKIHHKQQNTVLQSV